LEERRYESSRGELFIYDDIHKESGLRGYVSYSKFEKHPRFETK